MEITVPNGKFILPDNYEIGTPSKDANAQSWEIKLGCGNDATINFIPIAGKALTKLTVDGVTIPFTSDGGIYTIPIDAVLGNTVVFQFCDETTYIVRIKIYDGTLTTFVITVNKTGDGYVEIVYNNGLFAGLMFVPDDAVIQSITINGQPQTITNEHGMAIVQTLTVDITVNVNFI